MADAALARREARRRKILENSHNRLQRISGKVSDDSCRGSPAHASTSDNQDIDYLESSSKASLCNGILTPVQSEECLITTSNFSSTQEEIINDLTPLLPPKLASTSSESSQKSLYFDKLICYKYDIVLLSLFIQVLYNLSILSVDSTYFFLPLVTYGLTKIYWFPRQANSNFENMLMLLKGLSTHRVQKILGVTQIVSALGLDACIYMFTTICVQAICIIMKQNFIT